MKLANRLALITGGGRGIGRAIAHAFAVEGADIAIAARSANKLEETAREIEQNAGRKPLTVTCDVSDRASVDAMFTAVAEKFGRGPDIMVNNAGIAESAPLTRTDDDLWNRHLAINLNGTFYCTRAALPGMLERGWGRIINIASIAAKAGAPYIAAYAASKHGVLGLTRSVALETASKGITVNAICPGYVDTEMTSRGIENITKKTKLTAEQAMESIKKMSPQNRIIDAEEVAALALLLASDDGRGITGQAINVDGGSVMF